MTTRVEGLDASRKTGDLFADDIADGVDIAVIFAYLDEVKEYGLAGITEPGAWENLKRKSAFVEQARRVLDVESTPAIEVFEAMDEAKRLFARFGEEISGALLLAALPEAFAAEKGARVLTVAQGLTVDVRIRIRGTAQFLMLALVDDRGVTPEDRWSRSIRAVHALRLHHAAVRRVAKSSTRLPIADGIPINQEDLLGTLLTFTVTVFEVLEKLGITWSKEEQLAYLMAWDHIGKLLGISVEKNSPVPRPQSVGAARSLLAVIRDRQWRDSDDFNALSLAEQWQDTSAGRTLIHALLNELTQAMPRGSKSLPAAVMRQLLPEVVRDRLGLGDGGLLELALDSFPRRARLLDNFTRLQPTSRLGHLPLRLTANFVTRCSISHFVRGPGPRFVIPRLEDWVDAIKHSV